MKKVLAIEPVVPMSAIDMEVDILAEKEEKILIQNWRGEYLQLTPSCEKDNKIIYRVEDQAKDLSLLKFGWVDEKGNQLCVVKQQKKN